jgi:hypothetical protein
LGEIELRQCPTCEKERPFKLFIQYKYAHLYYLRWVTEKKYHLACDICRRGVELNSKTVEAKLEKNPIPFMTRFGWAFLVGLIAVIFVAANTGKH